MPTTVAKDDIRLLSVCVQYDDLLAITLPSWLPHVKSVLIITSPDDVATQQLAASHGPQVQVYTTDAFYRYGAHFNKGLAIEEAFDVLGREGWLLIADADIVFPNQMDLPELSQNMLYTPRRRILDDLRHLDRLDSLNDRVAPVRNDGGHYGYFQLFHADAPQLQARPWYTTDWTHAGGADNDFQNKFPASHKCWLRGFTVTHLGPCDENWFGRSTARVDTGAHDAFALQRRELQEALKRKHGWGRRKTDEPLQERIGE